MIEDYYALWINLLEELRPVWSWFVLVVVAAVVISIGTIGDRS